MLQPLTRLFDRVAKPAKSIEFFFTHMSKTFPNT